MDGSNYLMRARKKRRHKLSKMLLTAIIIAVFMWCFFIASDIYGWMGSPSQINIEIPPGSNLTQVSQLLNKKGIISHPLVFRTVVRIIGNGEKIKMGNHILQSDMSYFDISKEISETSQIEGMKITIPEGFESYKIADALAEKGLVDKSSFINKVSKGEFNNSFLKSINRKTNRLEGYLFPATYTFKEGTSEDEIIETFLNKFSEEFDQKMIDRTKELGMTTDQVVTLASIIEREAKNNDEMPIISSIFHNRLEKGSKYPYLQSCATIQYLLKERKAVLSVQDTKIKSPYNTYNNKGLPPGPIANPGKPALMAALYPEQTDYYFFVLNKEGTQHIYSKTFEEHEKAVRENQ